MSLWQMEHPIPIAFAELLLSLFHVSCIAGFESKAPMIQASVYSQILVTAAPRELILRVQ